MNKTSNIYKKYIDKKIYNKNLEDLSSINNNWLKEFQNNNKTIILGNSKKKLDIEVDKITIDIPIVFHLIDPLLTNQNINYWKEYIDNNIISSLNKDYNVSYMNYATKYINIVKYLFANADPSKKLHYLNLVNTLPNIQNLKWIFKTYKIIIKPLDNLNINERNNDHIYKLITLEDPELYLNIVIAPSEKVLGSSGFAFNDRDYNNNCKIDIKYKYKNAILINTKIFQATKPPFNKYRTFTHEIGHWCGLLHPFDCISCKTNEENKKIIFNAITDISKQIKPTYGTVYDRIILMKKIVDGKPTFIRIRKTPYAYIFEKNNETPNFFNFMDYTNDEQMCMFTHKQILYMLHMLAAFRPNFIKYS